MKSAVKTACYWYYAANTCCSKDNYRTLAALLLLGIAILDHGHIQSVWAQGGGPTGSHTNAQFEPILIEHGVGNLFMLIEGAFGALVMVVSGIGAIIAASMGAYRAAVGMLVVAVGSFILRSLVSLFFGTDFTSYEATS